MKWGLLLFVAVLVLLPYIYKIRSCQPTSFVYPKILLIYTMGLDMAKKSVGILDSDKLSHCHKKQSLRVYVPGCTGVQGLR